MIQNSDSGFHQRDPNDRTWTETTFLPFFIADPGIFGNLYVLARPNLGVAISSILVSEGFCVQPYEVDFTDSQMHLPCPTNFSNYKLENGLSVEALDGPNAYRFDYESTLGTCAFRLNFQGLHQPFDPHDPSENPLISKEADPRVGTAWMNGHFEVKGHVTGELMLRGKKYQVDCYEGMDHSWGPRSEVGTRSVSWVSINFGPELAFHIAVPLDLNEGDVTYDKLRFGFVVDNGIVYGLVDSKIETSRAELLPIGISIWVKDIRGKEYEIFGSAVAGHPWYSFNPCHVSFQSYMRYRYQDKTGYGEVGDIFGLDYLGGKMSRAGKRSRK